THRFPEAILTTRLHLPVMAAAAALNRGAPAGVLELLEPVRPFDHSTSAAFWPSYLRGQAHLQLARGAEAAIDFRSIIEHRGELPDSPLYPLAHLGLARALASASD